MKTLINTLYIGLLIIAPICGFFCGYFPVVLVAFVAVLFAPMILALILNTAHKIAISLLNVALLGSSNTLCKDGNQTGFWLVLGALGALWLWQCFDGRRPRKLPR